MGRLQYVEDDEKALLMGNAMSLYLIYALTTLTCFEILRISYRLWRTPKKTIAFTESLKRDGYENVPNEYALAVRQVTIDKMHKTFQWLLMRSLTVYFILFVLTVLRVLVSSDTKRKEM